MALSHGTPSFLYPQLGGGPQYLLHTPLLAWGRGAWASPWLGLAVPGRVCTFQPGPLPGGSTWCRHPVPTLHGSGGAPGGGPELVPGAGVCRERDSRPSCSYGASMVSLQNPGRPPSLQAEPGPEAPSACPPGPAEPPKRGWVVGGLEAWGTSHEQEDGLGSCGQVGHSTAGGRQTRGTPTTRPPTAGSAPAPTPAPAPAPSAPIHPLPARPHPALRPGPGRPSFFPRRPAAASCVSVAVTRRSKGTDDAAAGLWSDSLPLTENRPGSRCRSPPTPRVPASPQGTRSCGRRFRPEGGHGTGPGGRGQDAVRRPWLRAGVTPGLAGTVARAHWLRGSFRGGGGHGECGEPGSPVWRCTRTMGVSGSGSGSWDRTASKRAPGDRSRAVGAPPAAPALGGRGRPSDSARSLVRTRDRGACRGGDAGTARPVLPAHSPGQRGRPCSVPGPAPGAGLPWGRRQTGPAWPSAHSHRVDHSPRPRFGLGGDRWAADKCGQCPPRWLGGC